MKYDQYYTIKTDADMIMTCLNNKLERCMQISYHYFADLKDFNS